MNECGFCDDDIYTCNVNAGRRIIDDCQDQAITPVIPADAYDLLMSTGLNNLLWVKIKPVLRSSQKGHYTSQSTN